MNVSAWAIRNPVPVCLLFLMLTLLGFGAFGKLGINQWPDVDIPMVVVSVSQAGASPSELENSVTRKVEDALVGIRGLDHIRSTVTEGSSSTVIDFEVGTDTARALNEVRSAVGRVRQSLPADIDEPDIIQPNMAGDPFATYTVSSPKRSVAELSRLVDKAIARALLTVDGVSQVKREGGLSREIRVTLSPERLEAYGTTVDHVNGQLRALQLDTPGGKTGETGIRLLGATRTVEELAALPVPLEGGRRVRLGLLGTVKDGYADVRQIARLDGQSVVGFSLVRSQGAALVQTEERVKHKLETFAAQLPADVQVKLVRTQADFSRAAFTASLDALYIGAALAIVVIFFFLRDWASTIIAGFAIPLSVVPTFFVMKQLGYSLNGMTLVALTLVVGILVDDAIVDLENIHRHVETGKSPWQAAFEATEEIGLAVIATTFAIVAVFVPMAYMGGISGMFFASFGLTVATAVLFSLLVARTLTPLLAARWLPEHKAAPAEAKKGQPETAPAPSGAKPEPGYRRFYMTLLAWSLRHRAWVMGAAAAVFIGSLALVPFLAKGFMDNGDQGEAVVLVSLPSGARVEETDAVVRHADALLRARPEVRSIFATAGTTGGALEAADGASGSGGVSEGRLYVSLKPRHDRKLSLDAFIAEVAPQLRRIPGARVVITEPGAGGGSSKAFSFLLRGDDAPALAASAERVLAELRAQPILVDVTSSAAETRPEIQVKPDPERAAEQGVLVSSIARLARLASQGDAAFNLAKFESGGDQLNVRVQLEAGAVRDVHALGNLKVPGASGLVPLRSVADVRAGEGPVQINRYDRTRQVTFSANLAPGASLGEAMALIDTLPSMRQLPATVSHGTLGDADIMAEIFQGFINAFVMGIVLIYVVLVLLFKDFLQPFTIMGALPLSFGGAFAGLLLTGKPLDMMSLIGIIMLMGLATKNSILLVEHAAQSRRNGMARNEALLEAGRDRLRPILMTTIAMVAGMLPIAWGLGEGTERLSPMAVAVIGGLLTSTLLTLVVIPVTYALVDDMQAFALRVLPKRKRRGAPADEAPEGARENSLAS